MTSTVNAGQRQRQAALDLHRRILGDWCPGLEGEEGHDVHPPDRLLPGAWHGGTDLRTIPILCSPCVSRVLQPP